MMIQHLLDEKRRLMAVGGLFCMALLLYSVQSAYSLLGSGVFWV